MKIAIISDTHIQKKVNDFKRLIEKEFNQYDLIIHSGDYNHLEVLEILQATNRFVGVWGNADVDEIKARLNEKEIIEVEGFRLGIFHGHGEKKTTHERAFNVFEAETVDIIIFGHSHQPLIQTRKGILMLNPGSITSKRRERWFSYISLEIGGGGINPQLRFREMNML